jgi:hypothetical protein
MYMEEDAVGKELEAKRLILDPGSRAVGKECGGYMRFSL